jgi:predicted nucleic acid-binding protein
MHRAISNTSPLLYLYRIGAIEWLPHLFEACRTPSAVIEELREGQHRGYNVPDPSNYEWLQIVNPAATPFEWLALDLGAGERSAMALALENPSRILLLDDLLARRTAQAAGLTVWETLKVRLEAKAQGLTQQIEPFVMRLSAAGMWLSDDLRRRILALANEMPS